MMGSGPGVFARHVRCSGVGVSHNLCMAPLSGTTLMVATYLIQRTQNDMSPPLHLIGAVMVSALFVQKPGGNRPPSPAGVSGCCRGRDATAAFVTRSSGARRPFLLGNLPFFVGVLTADRNFKWIANIQGLRDLAQRRQHFLPHQADTAERIFMVDRAIVAP